MEKQLSDFTVVELKAIAYDQLAQIEMAQNNLRAINQELAKRVQPNGQFLQQSPPGQNNTVVEPLPPGSIHSV